MKTIINILAALLVFLNLFGGIVSGIWLVILGEWETVGIGVLAMVLSVPILGIAGQLSLPLTAAASYFYEKGFSILVGFFLFLSNIYVIALIFVWCVGVYIYFGSRAVDAGSFLPTVIWSYGVALAPWVYMAKQEVQGGTGEGSALITLFAQIGYVVMMLMILFMHVSSLMVLISVFGAILSIGLLFLWVETIRLIRMGRLIDQ